MLLECADALTPGRTDGYMLMIAGPVSADELTVNDQARRRGVGVRRGGPADTGGGGTRVSSAGGRRNGLPAWFRARRIGLQLRGGAP